MRSRLAAVALLLLAACSGVEEKRIRQLLNERGFGTRAQGVATLENFVAAGDQIVFFLEPSILLQPGYEQLALLARPQAVGIDGTILLPYVGPVPVLGLTERELQVLVEDQLQGFFNIEIQLQARIVGFGKAIYAFGETLQKGRLAMPRGDLTIFEFVSIARWTPLANLGRVKLVRPDAENPLVMTVNFREMVQTGNMAWNVQLQNDDIVYIPPTFFGAITRFLQKLLEPIGAVVSTIFGVARVRRSYDYLVNDDLRLFFFGF
jgi:protein involved in polysaccharide export with SLBB domain